jgi:hypothetical protein
VQAKLLLALCQSACQVRSAVVLRKIEKNRKTMAIGNGMFQAWEKQRKPIHLRFHQIVTCITLNVISFEDEDKV